MADLFLQRNLVREATAFLLDVLQVCGRGSAPLHALAARVLGALVPVSEELSQQPSSPG